MGEEWVYIRVRLRRSDYEALRARARALGYPTVSDYASAVLSEAAARGGGGGGAGQVDARGLAEDISARLERRLADLLNPFTGKIDEINRRLADLVEALEAQRPSAQPAQPEPEEAERPYPKAGARQAGRGEKSGVALERLREEGVLFSSEASWIRSPEKFFKYLEKRGAVVLDLRDEKVAVDPELWERFRELVEGLEVSDVEEAERIVGEELGEKAAKLFRKLVAEGVAMYDEDRRVWIIYMPP